MTDQEKNSHQPEETFKKILKEDFHSTAVKEEFTDQIMERIGQKSLRTALPLISWRLLLIIFAIIISLSLLILFFASNDSTILTGFERRWQDYSTPGLVLFGAIGAISFFIILDALLRRSKKSSTIH